MNTWALLSLVSLSATLFLSVLGLYHRAYKDNLLQCIGMIGLAVFSLSRINAIWHEGYVGDPSVGLLHASMAVYAIGTALKVVVHYGREQGWQIVAKADQALETRRSTASGAFDSKPHHHV